MTLWVLLIGFTLLAAVAISMFDNIRSCPCCGKYEPVKDSCSCRWKQGGLFKTVPVTGPFQYIKMESVGAPVLLPEGSDLKFELRCPASGCDNPTKEAVLLCPEHQCCTCHWYSDAGMSHKKYTCDHCLWEEQNMSNVKVEYEEASRPIKEISTRDINGNKALIQKQPIRTERVAKLMLYTQGGKTVYLNPLEAIEFFAFGIKLAEQIKDES